MHQAFMPQPTATAIITIQKKLRHINKAVEVRVLVQELRYLNAEIAIAQNDDHFMKSALKTNCAFSIPFLSSEDKGVMLDA